jgi:hypothetical protein
MVIATLKGETTITTRMVTSNVIILATAVMEGDISVVIVVVVVELPGVLIVEVSVLVLELSGEYTWVVDCMPLHSVYTVCLLSINSFSTSLPEHRNKMDRESACSQWLLLAMADGVQGGRWLLGLWVNENLCSFFGQLALQTSIIWVAHLIVPENTKVLVSALHIVFRSRVILY